MTAANSAGAYVANWIGWIPFSFIDDPPRRGWIRLSTSVGSARLRRV
jgi:hypothetical protein